MEYNGHIHNYQAEKQKFKNIIQNGEKKSSKVDLFLLSEAFQVCRLLLPELHGELLKISSKGTLARK